MMSSVRAATIFALSRGPERVLRPAPAIRMPLGAASIAASLSAGGIHTCLVDMALRPGWSINELAGLLSEAPAVGISCMSDCAPDALKAVEVARAEGFCGPIVLGGPGATSSADEVMSGWPGVDCVVAGEGESVAPAVFSELMGEKSLRGVSGIRAGGMLGSSPCERIRDLDALYLQPRYDRFLGSYGDVIPIETSRGCPYACTFCDASALWSGKRVSRSPESVLREVAHYVELGHRRFHFLDDTLTASPSYALRLCEGLSGLSVTWHCSVRAEHLCPVLIDSLAEAGCVSVFVGIESGAEEVRNVIRKPIDLQAAQRGVLYATARLSVTVSLMWGFPFETLSHFRETLQLSRSLSESGAKVSLYRLMPLPGSPLYADNCFSLRPRPESAWPGCLPGMVGTHEVRELMRRYPRVFATYFDYETPEVSKKVELLEAESGVASDFF